eukprot:TRINITY_DN27729_c0_g1_i1.p1 TRINITY_DN27729_c0_g1~~TRINITY_DN27729_c0_g1_i1.p1  ORF type:complete len:449 (+),score=113.99 TRINITY_DN27729_c0_g1_i1:48-1349(+)
MTDPQMDKAKGLMLSGKYNEAYAELTALIKKEPLNGYAMVHRAQTCAILNKSEEMMQDIKITASLFPNWKEGKSFGGYLRKFKDTKPNTQPKKHYFILKGRFILWFDGESLGQLRNGAYLHDFNVIEGGRREKFIIQVNNQNPSYFHLEADSVNERVSWMKELENINRSPKITLFGLDGKEVPLMSDFVIKSASKNKGGGTKRRYCVIRGNIFYYYVSQNDPAPKGYWDLKECEPGRYKVQPGATKFKFKITLKEDRGKAEERDLIVDSDEKREAWLRAVVDASKLTLSLVEKPAPKTPQTPMQNSAKPRIAPNSPAPPVPTSSAPTDRPTKAKATKQPHAPPELRPAPAPPSQQRAPLRTDLKDLKEITEMISPRPAALSAFYDKLFSISDKEKNLNAEALKTGSGLSVDEEWEDEENDWISEEDEGKCFVS